MADKNWYINSDNQVGSTVITIKEINKPSDIDKLKDPNSGTPDDDLFIIYENGTYLNTRPVYFDPVLKEWVKEENKRLNLIFKNGTKVGQKSSISIKNVPAIHYLYWTNKYDNDDPPGRIAQGQEGQLSNLVRGHVQDSRPILWANHDIVTGKDISLIIDKSIFPVNAAPGEAITLTWKLLNNERRPVTLAPAQEIFKNIDIFENNRESEFGFIYSHGEILNNLISNNKIVFDKQNNGHHHFVNLRLRDEITIKDIEKQVVRFKLIDGERKEFIWDEQIRKAHDPNVIKAESYSDIENTRSINYFVQFENDGGAAAEEIRVELELPNVLLSHLDNYQNNLSDYVVLNQFVLANSSVLGNERSVSFDGNKIIISFTNTLFPKEFKPEYRQGSFYLNVSKISQAMSLADERNYEITGRVFFLGEDPLDLDWKNCICYTEAKIVEESLVEDKIIAPPNSSIMQKKTITIPGMAFRPKDVQSGYPETYIMGTIGLNGAGRFTYPLILPSGSIITGMELFAIDGQDLTEIGVSLLASDLNNLGQILISQIETAGSNQGVQQLSTTFREIVSVDKGYFLQTYLSERNVNLTLVAVRIEYEL